jgi:hypothetical protein
MAKARIWTAATLRLRKHRRLIKNAKPARSPYSPLDGESAELTARGGAKNAGVPGFGGTSFFGQNKEHRELPRWRRRITKRSTITLTTGGKKNFENLNLNLANRFLGANYTIDALPTPLGGIYPPDFENVPTRMNINRGSPRPPHRRI